MDGGDGGSLTHLESDDGVVKIEGEEGLRQLAEERLQDDCRDVHVPIFEHDLLAIVDFALEGNRRICKPPSKFLIQQVHKPRLINSVSRI